LHDISASFVFYSVIDMLKKHYYSSLLKENVSDGYVTEFKKNEKFVCTVVFKNSFFPARNFVDGTEILTFCQQQSY